MYAEGTPIDRAIARGVRDALRRHKLLGQAVATRENGKVVWIPAEQINGPDEEEAESAG